MCVICKNGHIRSDLIVECDVLTEIPDLYMDMVTSLRCAYCPLLKKLPDSIKLKILIIEICPLLTEIPEYNRLEYLWCIECVGIEKIPFFPSLKLLNINRSFIKKISDEYYMSKLEVLSCENSFFLEKIPTQFSMYPTPGYPFLKKLNISFTQISEIPIIPGLKELYCANTPIREIPEFFDLEILLCYKCFLLLYIPTQTMTKLKLFRWYDCPWLLQNPDNKIIIGLKLQKWIKNNFKYFVFNRWIESIEGKEFLYHPDRIGGRIEKSKMEKTLLSLN